MSYRALRILLVEDSDDEAQLLKLRCRRADLRIEILHHVRRVSEALRQLADDTYDIVLLDLALPDSQGMDTVQRLIERSPDTPVVVLTANQEESTFLSAIRAGAQDFIFKNHMDGSTFRRSVIFAIERQAIILELRRKAFTDGLTGICNQQGFMFLAPHQLKLALRTHQPAALIYLDLDNLKLINDQFGHTAGDAAIKELATLLKANCRESDLIARIGGDEFVIFAITVADPGGHELLNRLTSALVARQASPDQGWPLSVSHGVCPFDPQAPKSFVEMIVAADQAMYAAKHERAGRHEQ